LGALEAAEAGVLWHRLILATFGPESVGRISTDPELSIAEAQSKDSIIGKHQTNLGKLLLNKEFPIFRRKHLLAIEDICQRPMEWLSRL
jgi:hypothetical protein